MDNEHSPQVERNGMHADRFAKRRGKHDEYEDAIAKCGYKETYICITEAVEQQTGVNVQLAPRPLDRADKCLHFPGLIAHHIELFPRTLDGHLRLAYFER